MSPASGEYGISEAESCSPSTCGYFARNASPRNLQYSSRLFPSKFSVSRWMKFFIESVAMSPLLSPSVYVFQNALP
jgi:hypothetical protein